MCVSSAYMFYTVPAQLYIKVSEDLGQQQPAQQTVSEDMPDMAMTLLDPHLPLLSHYWLAALQDHAHLMLPPQFSRQLPAAGGMFYSTNVSESVKPYFEKNWPSLLHAAAIWLQTTGLLQQPAEKQRNDAVLATLLMAEPLLSTPGASFSSAPSPLSDPLKDRFHLVLGLAVQTLCAPATLDLPSTLLHCLKALRRLLEAGYVQNEINSDTKLATEILHLLHRLLLTCQSHDLHVVVMQIAVLVGRALQDGNKAGGKTEEEGDQDTKEGELETGRSPVFALLEVSACCLLRLVPDLMPKELESTSIVVSHSQSSKLTSEELTVASHAVSLLSVSVSLCSPQATESALPTVLHVLLHTVRFASLNQPLSAPLLSSCVLSLQQLCSELPLSHPEHGRQLSLALQAALTSLLGADSGSRESQTSSALSQTDREVKLLVVAVLLRVPSSSVCPSGSRLFEACVQLFKDCLFSPNAKVILYVKLKIAMMYKVYSHLF